MGWIGNSSQLHYTLDCMGADKDETGKFKIYNSAPVSFMGCDDEMVVDDDCCYSVNDKKASLAGALNGTSYGLQVKVI
jgi:hypothetical protein